MAIDRRAAQVHRHELRRLARRRRAYAHKRTQVVVRAVDQGDGSFKLQRIPVYRKSLRTTP